LTGKGPPVGPCRGLPALFIPITVSIVGDIITAVAVLSAFGVSGAVPAGPPQPSVDDHLLAETDGDDGQGGGVQKMDKRTDPVVHGEADHPKDDQYPDEV
jgi:hypothetical protein